LHFVGEPGEVGYVIVWWSVLADVTDEALLTCKVEVGEGAPEELA